MNRRILIVVTGGIAAYKAADLVRKLQQKGWTVRVVMTAAATSFITPLTLQTLSGNPVGVDMFGDPRPADPLAHLSFARWAELVVVCPATANILAKMAHGIADDLASATLVAVRAPVVACPAMNDGMWEHPATQANIEILRQRGVHLIGPDSGELACQTEGKGRMSEPLAIVAELERLFIGKPRPRVIVTAGATREPLDGVRVLTNVSSGQLGAAIVDAATERGFEAVWIHSSQAARPRAACLEVRADTVAEVEAAMRLHLADRTVTALVHGMAVSDFQCGGVLTLTEAHSLFSRSRNPKEALAGLAKLAGGTRRQKKISSAEPILPWLVPGKKLLDSVRDWAANPKLRLVSFKLTSGASKKELVGIAREQLTRTGSDLVVANDSRDLSPDGHQAWLVSASKVEGAFVGKAAIAREIAARL